MSTNTPNAAGPSTPAERPGDELANGNTLPYRYTEAELKAVGELIATAFGPADPPKAQGAGTLPAGPEPADPACRPERAAYSKDKPVERLLPAELELLPSTLNIPRPRSQYQLIGSYLGSGYTPKEPDAVDAFIAAAIDTYYLRSDLKLEPRSFAAMLQMFVFMAKHHNSEVSVRLVCNTETPQLLEVVLPVQKVSAAHCLVDLSMPMLHLGTGDLIEYASDEWAVCGSIHSHVAMSPWPSHTDDQHELDDPGLHMIVGNLRPDPAKPNRWRGAISATVVHDGRRHRFTPDTILDGGSWELGVVTGPDQRVSPDLVGLFIDTDDVSDRPAIPQGWTRYITLPPPPPVRNRPAAAPGAVPPLGAGGGKQRGFGPGEDALDDDDDDEDYRHWEDPCIRDPFYWDSLNSRMENQNDAVQAGLRSFQLSRFRRLVTRMLQELPEVLDVAQDIDAHLAPPEQNIVALLWRVYEDPAFDQIASVSKYL